MSNPDNHFEIERKYLIEYPNAEELAAMPGARDIYITQTYLLSDVGERRVRKWEEGDKTSYITTFKLKKSAIKRIEIEEEISEREYNALLETADPAMHPLHKRRIILPYGSHTAEIDIYPFFTDRAILEVELSEEDEVFELPDFVTVIREVTGEREYKNPVLAKYVKECADMGESCTL